MLRERDGEHIELFLSLTKKNILEGTKNIINYTIFCFCCCCYYYYYQKGLCELMCLCVCHIVLEIACSDRKSDKVNSLF